MSTPGRVRVGVYAVCVRDDRLLLVHQVSPGPAQDRWTLPGGGLDYGESPADGVRREVREETGCEVSVGRILGVDDAVQPGWDGVERHGIRLMFHATLEGEPVSPDDGEIDEVGWFPIDALPENATVWAAQVHDLLDTTTATALRG
ncbi:NUDIX hydrolase [Luteipulveratus flavus]|uniref:NUDIX domain-containing protein n=1 Tax=Luteipulveratus flavus TaxID=3031728 RepID=A0ABT6CBY1_9MICO|nr:NUDIX domain-containing protein [Luteipulveratus sp. YIM 133296]MDF8266415.1 NUDIX domain-containing protein [Luteipulveratus sp. YIM 133296]